MDGVDIPGTISVREYDHKSVEGVNSNGFVVYPIFQCAGCRKTKSSMEISDLSKMGVPPYILRRCPVISMLKTSYSSELAELILTLMTSELGAGQIANFINKKRATFWVSQARVYLEAHVANTEDISSLSAFGFTRSISSSPFPNLVSSKLTVDSSKLVSAYLKKFPPFFRDASTLKNCWINFRKSASYKNFLTNK